PEHEVELVPLARVVGVGAALATELDHGRVVEAAQPPVIRVHARVEEDPAAHLADVLGRARRHVDREEPDLAHVVVEHAHLLGGQLAEVDAALARDPQDVVIDVGDVADAAHAQAGVPEATMQHVEDVIDECMTEVRRVVGRDAADVDTHLVATRLEGHHLLASGVEQLHAARFYGALDSTPCVGSGSSRVRAASRTERVSLKLSRALASAKPSQAASAISAGSGCNSVPAGASTTK